ncbi:MAG: NAD-dependent epimerase/dehydratase family protein, partial [Spirochaetota bacterium]
MKRILLTGALGQIGSELTMELRTRYGRDKVIATDIRQDVNREVIDSGPFALLDCRDGEALAELVSKHKIDTIYHLA